MINKETIGKILNKETSNTKSILANGICLPYQVEHSYFERFPIEMLEKVSTSDKSQQPNYAIPNNYFDGLAGTILSKIKAEDSSNEILNAPTLNNLSKENLYELPEGYFENFNITVNQPEIVKVEHITNSKVVSINKYKQWMNIAVAASILGIVIASAILFSTKNNNSERYLSYKSVDVKGNVNKLSDDELVRYLNTDVEAASVDMTIIEDGAEPDVDQRIKSVSDFDLDLYLQESAITNLKKGI